jgi:hypothetical protein
MINPATYVRLSPFARKMLIRQTVGSIGMTVAILGLAKMAGIEVEEDPHSSDFGKLKFGNVRIDISGGKLSMIVFLSRMAPDILGGGYTKAITGKESKLDRKNRPFGPTRTTVLERYGRGKLAPTASLLGDIFIFHNNYKGDPVRTPEEISKAIAQRFYPMSITDTISLYEDDIYGDVFTDAAFDIWATIMSQFGSSVNVYKEDKEK